jgi:hypothetical protein
MNIMQQWLVWIKRISHCRGFGIQNPDDYFFVRYVVNEKWPYHAYEQLPPDNDRLTVKLGRFYLRLANYLQPAYIADLVGMGAFFKAGCHKASFLSTIASKPATESDNAIVVVNAQDFDNTILNCCSANTVLVVHQLWKQKELWEALTARKEVTTSFNLYYCGVFFFSHRLSRQHYIVNF